MSMEENKLVVTLKDDFEFREKSVILLFAFWKPHTVRNLMQKTKSSVSEKLVHHNLKTVFWIVGGTNKPMESVV